jgi:nuclear transport factor 2 (NTF2) superfamily protein
MLLRNNASWLVDKDNGLWWRNYGGTNLAFKRMSLIKDVNPNTENIKIALNDGWVITFHKELQNLLSLFVKGQHI